jgi:hypothetical protein
MDLKVITKAQNFLLQMSKIRTMLVTFCDKQVVTHKEFVPEGQTVNSAFYVEIIGRLLKRISRLRPQFRAEVLVARQCPSHSALAVKKFLARHGVVEISHPPYSPYVALANIFPFLQ